MTCVAMALVLSDLQVYIAAELGSLLLLPLPAGAWDQLTAATPHRKAIHTILDARNRRSPDSHTGHILTADPESVCVLKLRCQSGPPTVSPCMAPIASEAVLQAVAYSPETGLLAMASADAVSVFRVDLDANVSERCCSVATTGGQRCAWSTDTRHLLVLGTNHLQVYAAALGTPSSASQRVAELTLQHNILSPFGAAHCVQPLDASRWIAVTAAPPSQDPAFPDAKACDGASVSRVSGTGGADSGVLDALMNIHRSTGTPAPLSSP